MTARIYLLTAQLGLRIFHFAIFRLIGMKAFCHRWELAAQTKADNEILLEILKMDLAELKEVKKEKAACDRGLQKANHKDIYGTKSA